MNDFLNLFAAWPLPEIEISQLIHEFQPTCIDPQISGDDLTIIYLRQGTASFEIDTLPVDAHSGILLVIPPNSPHSGQYHISDRSGKFEQYTVALRNVRLPGLPDGYLLSPACSPIVQLDTPGVPTAIFHLLEREYLVREAGWETICRSALYTLFILICRSAVLLSDIPQPISQTQPQTLASDILSYLHTHYCENITLQSVADHFYISHYYLSHLVKKHLGVPMMQYVIQLRISEAQTLLRDTDYTIRQIAQMVGYDNLNYFSQVFKKAAGISPSEYRAQPSPPVP